LLERAGFAALALSPGGGERLAGLARPDRVAVLLGTEGPGLDAEVLRRTRTVSIPMAAGWDSLNVAAASAVMLHELTQGDARR
jgi:tRNA G18 (ribose-2'-O)-methylase SpoU